MFNVRILFRVQNYGEKPVIIPISVVFLVEDYPESLREDPPTAPPQKTLPRRLFQNIN